MPAHPPPSSFQTVERCVQKIRRDFVKFPLILPQNGERLLVLLLHDLHHLLVDGPGLSPVSRPGEVSPPRYWLFTVSMATISNSSVMPYRVTMARASLVALFDIIGSSGGDGMENQLLRRPAACVGGDLI